MGLDLSLKVSVFDGYLTHNLTKMAEEAGLYKVLWRPEEEGIWYGEDLIEPLKKGIEKLKRDPKYYYTLNPPNGWGTYENLLGVCERLLAACTTHPKGQIYTYP